MKKFKKVRRFFKRIKCELMYRKAVGLAEKASALHQSEVYFVLPTAGKKLMVASKAEYLVLRKKKYTDKDAKPRQLYKDAIYHTLCHSKKAKRDKHRRFLRWQGVID